jgi:hypothetical protein
VVKKTEVESVAVVQAGAVVGEGGVEAVVVWP